MNIRPFHKVLVANRGEIAVRVFRTARALGYRCVAVYSEADADTPHVRLADEAVCIGPPAVSESYLNVAAILDAAARTQADAIHPGYGFLSEDASFAEACIAAGLVWIGPPPNAIQQMGDKAKAKAHMERADVPCVPGYRGDDPSLTAMREHADRIGYPLLVKAVGGGGGRGMRVVRAAAELEEALISARREAGSAFGNDTVMLEAFIDQARHIEIQVFADTHGHVVHLGERDCTTQRRRQKVIEEAPSPVLTPEQRAQMGTDAVNAARAIGYVGAGTVEMILGPDGRHYFLEMNTRLQVEHPVTELVTGFDLVEWQLRVAAGEPLPHSESLKTFQGHAIQARLYAEDPSQKFAPQTGPIRWFRPSGFEDIPGIRVDAGIEEGGAVSPFYDPMVAKVLAHGAGRAEAARKLAYALEELPLMGLTTNRDFLIRLLRSEPFLAATITTNTLDDWVAQDHALLAQPAPKARTWALAAALITNAHEPWFRSTGSAELTLRFSAPTATSLRLSREGDHIRVTSAESNVALAVESWSAESGRVRYLSDGVVRTAFAYRTETGLALDDGAGLTEFAESSPYPADAGVGDPTRVVSHVAGTVVNVAVQPGDRVNEGDTVVIVEAMKMETRLVARATGIVTQVRVKPGEQIETETQVADLELEGGA